MFLVPPSLLSGTANNEEYQNWIKLCITPILTAFETALNKDIASKRARRLSFRIDTGELMKADVETRFKSYEIGIKNAIYQLDEVRRKENLPPLGLKFLKMGLQDVLYLMKVTKSIHLIPINFKIGENTNIQPSKGMELSRIRVKSCIKRK